MVFEQLVVNGIIAGSEYALLAIGLTLIFGILRLIHFAHGEVWLRGNRIDNLPAYRIARKGVGRIF